MIDLHSSAARATIDISRHITADDLILATPCRDWNLRQLLDHMTSENLGFAAASHAGTDQAPWWLDQVTRDDPVAEYVTATEALIAAFAEPGVLQRTFALSLGGHKQQIPGERAVMMQLIDSVVHAWDLARTVNAPLTIDDELAATVLALCEIIPDDEARRKPGAAFAPRVPIADTAPTIDRIVALLGRSPTWPSPE